MKRDGVFLLLSEARVMLSYYKDAQIVQLIEENTMIKNGKQRFLEEQFKDKTISGWCKVSAIAVFCMIFLFPTFACSADDIPENVILVIEKKAVSQFPYDRNSQMRVIESQKSAYIIVNNYTNGKVPEDILKGIKERAAFECPTNYCAQKYLVETQARDCCYLMNYSPEGVPSRILKRMLHNAEGEFPNDYSTQKMVVEVKVKEYLNYDRITQLVYCEKELDAALDEMEEVLLSLQEKYVTLTQKLEERSEAEIQEVKIQENEAQEEKARNAEIQEKEIQKVEIQMKDTEVFHTTAVARQYHVVKRGENLYRISLRYGLSLNRLCKLNGITPEHTIWPGQRILISLSL
jgi:LysM repeat protein